MSDATWKQYSDMASTAITNWEGFEKPSLPEELVEALDALPNITPPPWWAVFHVQERKTLHACMNKLSRTQLMQLHEILDYYAFPASWAVPVCEEIAARCGCAPIKLVLDATARVSQASHRQTAYFNYSLWVPMGLLRGETTIATASWMDCLIAGVWRDEGAECEPTWNRGGPDAVDVIVKLGHTHLLHHLRGFKSLRYHGGLEQAFMAAFCQTHDLNMCKQLHALGELKLTWYELEELRRHALYVDVSFAQWLAANGYWPAGVKLQTYSYHSPNSTIRWLVSTHRIPKEAYDDTDDEGSDDDESDDDDEGSDDDDDNEGSDDNESSESEEQDDEEEDNDRRKRQRTT